MRSKVLTFTLAAACMAVSVSGSAKTCNTFPPLLPPRADAVMKAPQRAPLNQEAKAGLKVFGATQMDYYRKRSFVNYYENKYDLERLNNIYDDNDNKEHPDLYYINAGAYDSDNDCYYAYKVEYYTIGITYAYQWIKVNPKDGSWEVVKKLDNKEHDATPLYDMAYSPYDGEMWGLVQNVDGQIKSCIGLVDLTNSRVNDLIQLDQYYFAAAFDYDGNLYAVRWDLDKDSKLIGTRLDTFDRNFKVTGSHVLKVDGQAYLSYFQHGLDFDYSTGDLIWAATDADGKQKMIRINPDTYETENLGNVGFGETMIGIYVPYHTAADRMAPAMAKNLGFTVDANGQNNVTINWTNPTTTWNRKSLSDLKSVEVYRDTYPGTPIATLDAAGKEGQQMSYEDKGASKGVHTYYIIPVNAKGRGVQVAVEAYVGRDVPGPVNDLKVTAKDNAKSVEISWTAPTTGDSEGWFDKTITYDIVRMPGNTSVATGVQGLSYVDANIPEAQYYTYTVTPVTSDGRGTPATSDGILAGASLLVPFETDFSSRSDGERFRSFDNFGPSGAYEYTNNTSVPGTMAMCFRYNSGSNVTLSSPPMKLEKGKTYRVDWFFSFGGYGKQVKDRYDHIRIVGGTAANDADMTEILADYPEFLTEYIGKKNQISVYFESPVDGDYCIGFKVMTTDSDRINDWAYVTGFAIDEAPANDLQALDMAYPVHVSRVNDNVFDVTVYNNGSNDQDDYKVEVGISQLDGTFKPFATAQQVPVVKSHQSAVVRVVGHPDEFGIQDIAARVVLENDGNSRNDMTGLKEVELATIPAFNYTATHAESEHESTSVPFYTYMSNTLTQSIYTPEMLKLDNEENEIVGLAWEYFAETDVNDANVKVYLGTTERTSYHNVRPAFITEGNQLMFSDVIKIEEGHNKWMVALFDDSKPFKIGKDQNLVVTVDTEETAANGTFPVHFNTFNNHNTPFAFDDLIHTLCASNNGAIDINSVSEFNKLLELPVLHVALKGTVGIDEVTDYNTLSVRVFGDKVFFSPDVKEAAVYDINGRLMQRVAVNGVMSLEVAGGVYLLRATDGLGNAKTVKFVVR